MTERILQKHQTKTAKEFLRFPRSFAKMHLPPKSRMLIEAITRTFPGAKLIEIYRREG